MAAAAAASQVHEELHENGRLARRFNVLNGLMHGICEQWDDNGCMILRETWVSGIDEQFESYWPNGRMKARFDRSNVIYEMWYENGQQQWLSVNKKGSPPIGRAWDKNGKPNMRHWFGDDSTSC